MIKHESEVTPYNLDREMRDIAARLRIDTPEQALHFPRFLLVETVKVCNARCPFCAVEQWDRSVPFMSDELFDKIARELIEYADWIFYVYLQKSGEPLLDEKIGPRIRRLKEGGIRRINLSTNVSLLDEAKVRELIAAGLDEIMLSIDSIIPEKYRQMRPGLDYDTVIANTKRLFRLRDELKPDMLIRVRGIAFYDLDDPDSWEEINEWERFWSELKKPHDRIYMKKPHTWGNQKVWDGHTPTYEPVYHPCILPWSTCNINSNGKVPLCGQDYDAKLCLGDINTQSIKEVWTSAAWERIRELHRSGRRNEISFCRGCQLFDREFSLEKDRPELPIG